MGFSRIYAHPVKQTGAEALWEEQNIFPFNELIISWNALRPARGNYRISASVKSNSWSPWLSFAEWGADGQKTFASKPDGSLAASYQDIITLADGHWADAFRIKVEGPSTLETFDALYACASNLLKFELHSPPRLDPIRLPIESLRSQMALDHPRHKDLCSPTSTCMAIDFLLKKRIADPIDFAEKAHDNGFDIYGNWVLNVAESYQKLSGRYPCLVKRLANFAELHSHLMKGLPVVASIKGPLPQAPLPFQGGHLLLIMGWDSEKESVLCADPAFPTDAETLTSYPIKDFLAAWGRRKNLCYLFLAR